MVTMETNIGAGLINVETRYLLQYFMATILPNDHYTYAGN